MREGERLSLVSLTVQLLDEAQSWTGRTHIQKLVYFAQELLGLSSNYDFVLYQRGPYSFDLDGDIRSLRSFGAVEISPAPPYGPSYAITGSGRAIAARSPLGKEMRQNLTQLAEALGPRQARDLELLATTLYVMTEGLESDEDIIARVAELKPHFEKDEAQRAIREVEQMREQFKPSAGRQHQ